MSDFYGALAAGRMVSDALFINRWFDDLDAMRSYDVVARNGVLQSHLQRLGTAYNHLLDQHNNLVKDVTVAAKEADSLIADLNRRLAAVELERDRARAEAAYLRTAFDAGINLGSNR